VPNKRSKNKKIVFLDVVKKDRLPCPFNIMDKDLLNKVQFFNVYPDNDDVTVVYIIEGTGFADLKRSLITLAEKEKV